MTAAARAIGGAGQPAELRALAWARVALGAIFLIRTTPLLAPLHLK